MASYQLSKFMRTAVQPLSKFRQFCDPQDFIGKGLHRGQVFTWDVFSDVATAGTIVTETATVPVTNLTITQGTGTVTELSNSIPYTGMLDNLSELPVQKVINRALKNDCVKALDNQAYIQFNNTLLRAVASGGTNTAALSLTTNGTATTTNNVALGKNNVKAMVDLMKERNIPPYNGSEYIGLAHPSTWRGVRNDLESVYQYREEGFGMIYKGEIGKYEGVRFIEQNNIPKGFNGTAWTNSLSSWAFFFGEDTVAEAIVVPEEIRGKLPADYGRDKGIAWYYLGGFAQTQTAAQQTRIVKWDSGA